MLTEEEIKAVIGKAVTDAVSASVGASVKASVKAELGDYKIPKEDHYLDHMWLADWRRWQATVKNSALKAVITMMVLAIGTLAVGGFLVFGRPSGQ